MSIAWCMILRLSRRQRSSGNNDNPPENLIKSGFSRGIFIVTMLGVDGSLYGSDPKTLHGEKKCAIMKG
jgi:hypothetical protein